MKAMAIRTGQNIATSKKMQDNSSRIWGSQLNENASTLLLVSSLSLVSKIISMIQQTDSMFMQEHEDEAIITKTSSLGKISNFTIRHLEYIPLQGILGRRSTKKADVNFFTTPDVWLLVEVPLLDKIWKVCVFPL